jgi:sarcosine oxidase subunit beta
MAHPEILVVGGGIAGCSTAYHLARLGHRVVLLERGAIAGAASGLNAGSIECLGWGHAAPPSAGTPSPGSVSIGGIPPSDAMPPDGASRSHPAPGLAAPDLDTWLTAGSFDIFRALQLDRGHDIELRQSGGLVAIRTEEEMAWARQRVARLQRLGHRIELLDIREARAIEPEADPELLGFLHAPLRAQADPVKATRALAAEAERHGASVLAGHEVIALAADASSVRVGSAEREWSAAGLVLAAGPWCGPLGAKLGLDIPVVPVRGQMWATPPLPPSVFHTISAAESPLHWRDAPGGDAVTPPNLTHRGAQRLTRHLYGRQRRDGSVIFGGDRQLVGYDAEPDPAGIEMNHKHAAEVLPFLASVPRARTWGGLMPFSLDGKPLIGRLPCRAPVYVVSGLASSGFGRGPMAGRLLAELIHTGQAPPVLREADPARVAVNA